jgi:signal transduction histidine kinase
MRGLPRSFVGRLALLLIAAVFVAQAIAFALFAHERRETFHRVFHERFVTRTASVVDLINETSPSLHDRVLTSAGSRSLRFWVSDEAAIVTGHEFDRAERVGRDLAAALGLPRDAVRAGRASSLPPDAPLPYSRRVSPNDDDHYDDDDDDDDDREEGYFREHRRKHYEHGFHWLTLSVALPDGRWLNAAAGRVPGGPPLGAPFLVSLILSALAVGTVAVFAARRLSRPLRRLADAADRLGRGEAGVMVEEEGPDEARRSIRAFNRMHQRLTRFIGDRTSMLAAISHDLRTPITSLRLRAELIDDVETREKILETLSEMQEMTEATLDFAREDAAAEDTRSVDLTALVDSVVTDLVEIGRDARFEGGERRVYPCRPNALRRAIRNLVDNAATHGGGATVALSDTNGNIEIQIDDEGPGLPDSELETMFQPFVRLETSRNRDTGGVGLGLAIARGIVRSHGGDISLENRPEGGLRATIRLPD